MLWRMAWRNLFLHKQKTFVLGFILTAGLYVLVLGNSVMDTITAGLQRTYTESFTGDLAVVPSATSNPAIFTGGSAVNQGATAFPDSQAVLSRVASVPGVRAVTAQMVVRALLSTEDKDGSPNLVLGIDPSSYQEVFPEAFQLLEGQFLEPGGEGVLITESTRSRLRASGASVAIGTPLVLTSRNPITGFKARVVPLKGVIRFQSETALVQRVSLSDITTVRVLTGLNQALPLPAAPAWEPAVATDAEAAFTLETLEGPAVQAGFSAVEELGRILSSRTSAVGSDP